MDYDLLLIPDSQTYRAQSEGEAWMNFLIVAMYAGGEATNIEVAAWSQATHMLAIYQFCSGERHLQMHEAMVKRTRHGSKALIDGSLEYIHHDSRDTLFCLCADIVMASGSYNQSKKDTLQEIATVLQLDDATCMNIIEVLRIKNKRNYRQVRSLTT